MSTINMVPGTAKEVAAYALSRARGQYASVAASNAQSPGGPPLSPNVVAQIDDVKRRLHRAERRLHVLEGHLPGSSRYPHAVALAVDMVEDVVSVSWSPMSGEGPPDRMPGAYLAPSFEAKLKDTATRAHELWFNDTGDAFISFEDETDATMFAVAIGGAA